MSPSKRHLGKLGEHALHQWCAAVGVTSNPVSADETGWDSILEFPLPASVSGKPWDKLDPAPTVRVQVKATDKKHPALRVKLSNWVRLVHAADPAFVLALEFDGKPDCQRAFLIHVGETLMGRVLKRLRHLSVQAPDVPLHKRVMTVTYSQNEKLAAPDGETLVAAIRDAIDDSVESYRKWKTELRSGLGYEKGRLRVKVNVEVPEEYWDDPDEMMVDFDLGLLPHLRLRSAAAWDTRFGLETPDPAFPEVTGGSLSRSDRQEVAAGRLTLRCDEVGREVHVPARRYLPTGVMRVVSEEVFKERITAGGLQLLLAPGKNKIDVGLNIPDPSIKTPLNSLSITAEMCRFFATSDTRKSVGVEILFDGQPVARCQLPPTPVPDAWLAWSDLILTLRDVAYDLSIPVDTEVTVDELARFHTLLPFVRAFLRGDVRPVSLKFTLDPDSRSLEGRELHVPVAVDIPIDGGRILVSGLIIGLLRRDGRDGGYECQGVRSAVLRRQYLSSEEESLKDSDHLKREAALSCPEGSLVYANWRGQEAVEIVEHRGGTKMA